jgi:nicotinate-nucleotide adenylyltransferase
VNRHMSFRAWTLTGLAHTWPPTRRQMPDAQLVYLMGGDSLRDLPMWIRPEDFLARCSLGVLRRPGDAIDLAALESILPGITSKVEFIQAPPLDIASHEIRRRVRANLPLGHLVPAAVARIIKARRLYDRGTA